VAPRRLFALDQNFPEPIVRALDEFLGCARLVPVRQIDERMPRLEDWELLEKIHAHRGLASSDGAELQAWDGLITSDDAMLNDPRAMGTLKRTGLTLVIADGQGHNPVRATGLVLFHLDHICVHTVPSRPQIWTLRATQKQSESPDKHLATLASREKITVQELLAKYVEPLVSDKQTEG
jgi:hypothetical protein